MFTILPCFILRRITMTTVVCILLLFFLRCQSGFKRHSLVTTTFCYIFYFKSNFKRNYFLILSLQFPCIHFHQSPTPHFLYSFPSARLNVKSRSPRQTLSTLKAQRTCPWVFNVVLLWRNAFCLAPVNATVFHCSPDGTSHAHGPQGGGGGGHVAQGGGGIIHAANSAAHNASSPQEPTYVNL